MTDSKIYNVLKHFDKVEQNRLRKYICSPYFNVNETLMIFYDILAEHINANGEASLLSKENIWTQLYPNESFNDIRFRKLSSDLLKLVEGFLAQGVYDNNTLQQTSFLLEAIGKRKIEKLANSSVRSARLISDQQSEKSADFYFYQYLIEKNYHQMSEGELKRSDKSNVEAIINNLDKFYLSEKLRLYYDVLSRKNWISHEYQLLFIDEIISHIKNNDYTSTPSVSIYYQVLLTQTHPEDESHFHKLIELLDKYKSQFPLTEQYQLYSAALNYCVMKMNQGKQEFVREYHELFKFTLSHGIIFYATGSGELAPWYFKNGILLALRLGEYDWSEKFIKDYQYKLSIEYRDNVVSYSLALVYFYQKKYDKVIPLLQSVEFEDLSYNLGSKSMLIAIYFEQDEYEALFSLADAFKTYLNRHKDINEKMRSNYMNYIIFVRKLTKIMPGDKKAIENLREEIKNAKGVASEKWLLEKLAELE
jgi:hypothetical protein